jgi:hypothetical protein
MKINIDLIGDKLLPILLFTAAFMIGALLSYMWVIGYYASLGLKVPEAPIIAVYNFSASADNPTFFTISILNPSFSSGKAEIVDVKVLTSDGVAHQIAQINPPIPSGGFGLNVGDSKTFKCFWRWSNYTGQQITIIVSVKSGSGGTLTTILPLVELKAISINIDPMYGGQFNMTITNSDKSATSVDLSGVRTIVNGSVYAVEIEPNPPVRLEPGKSAVFLCNWSWSNYQGSTITIILDTLQGYTVETTYKVPIYALLNISEVNFNPDNITCFNVTVMNSNRSIIALKISDIRINIEDGVVLIPKNVTPSLPYTLSSGEEMRFTCELDWSEYCGKKVTIIISAEQGYKAYLSYRIPSIEEE